MAAPENGPYDNLHSRRVQADQVREGDWVRWPDDSDTIRRVGEVMSDSESLAVEAFSDDFDYEWQAHQVVEVWRALTAEESFDAFVQRVVPEHAGVILDYVDCLRLANAELRAAQEGP